MSVWLKRVAATKSTRHNVHLRFISEAVYASAEQRSIYQNRSVGQCSLGKWTPKITEAWSRHRYGQNSALIPPSSEACVRYTHNGMRTRWTPRFTRARDIDHYDAWQLFHRALTSPDFLAIQGSKTETQ